MKITVSRLNYTYFLVVGLVTLSPGAVRPAEVFQISYHRVVDKATYLKNPAKYEAAGYRHPETRNEVYIERQPSLQIIGSGIESVIARKNKIYGDSPDERTGVKRFIIGAKTGEKEDETSYPVDYTLTFKLKLTEWNKERLFSKKNLGQWYHIKLGIHDVGITLIGPMDDKVSEKKREFILYTAEGDANKINEMLSPIRDKVSWE